MSLLELIGALGITTTMLLAVLLLILTMPQVLIDGHTEMQASQIATNRLQEALIQGRYDYPSVISVSTTTLSIPQGPTQESSTTLFEVSLAVKLDPLGETKLLTSTIEWSSALGKSRFLTRSVPLTDTRGDEAGSCDRSLPTKLAVVGSLSLPYAISAMSTNSSFLALGSASTTVRTDPDIQIYSLSSSSRPTLVGAIDTASSTRSGVAAVALSSSTLYAASAVPANYSVCTTSASCGQLHLFSISTSSALTRITTYRLSTSTAPYALGSHGQASGKSMVLRGSLLYLGLTKTGSALGEEFNILDVQDPLAPLWLGGFTVGRSINQIQVYKDRAYLATDDPHRELIVLDIHDPQHPTQIVAYDAPGSTTFGYGEHVAVDPSGVVALGRSYSPDGPEVMLFSLPIMGMPVAPRTSLLMGSSTNPVSIGGIIVRDFLSYVLTDTTLELWDSVDPFHPKILPTPISLPRLAGISDLAAVELACVRKTLYAATNSESSGKGLLTIISST
jgi:hypothetical protein